MKRYILMLSAFLALGMGGPAFAEEETQPTATMESTEAVSDSTATTSEPAATADPMPAQTDTETK